MISNSTVNVKTEPSSRIVTVREARNWAKIPSQDDDSAIDSIIDLCQKNLEDYLDRRFISQTVEWFFDGCPYGATLTLPIGADVTAINSISYYTSSDELKTFSASNYTLDSDSIPNRILLSTGNFWPTELRGHKSFVIDFTVGKSDASTVNPRLRTAVLKMVASQMDNGRINDYLEANSWIQTALIEVFDLKTHFSAV